MVCLLALTRAHADEPALPAPATVQPAADATNLLTAAETTSEPAAADLARARAQFQKGVELAKEGEFSAAEQRFRGALALHHAPAVEYNLAAALFELRKYDEAFNRCQSVQHDPGAPTALRERAAALERALYPHVARLTVMASSPSNDLVVSVDGEPLPANMLGVPRAVTPGGHSVLARRAETTLSERTVDVPLRTAALVDVSLLVTEQLVEVQNVSPPPVALQPAPTSEPRDNRHSQRSKRLWLWGGLAVGVVAAGVAVGVGLSLAKREPKSQGPVAGDLMPGVLTWR